MRPLARIVLLSLLCLGPARGVEPTVLERFLASLTSLRTEFTQQVLDAHGRELERGRGTLLIVRPGKFRWDYTPVGGEAGQLLIADGQNLWFYDRELAQISVKPAAAALSATPVMLLSGTPEQLRAQYQLEPLARQDGLERLRVIPRQPGGDFSRAELSFEGPLLKRMLIHDRLGQTVTLEFTRSIRNGAVDPAELSFQPPGGVDVIGTPQH